MPGRGAGKRQRSREVADVFAVARGDEVSFSAFEGVVRVTFTASIERAGRATFPFGIVVSSKEFIAARLVQSARSASRLSSHSVGAIEDRTSGGISLGAKGTSSAV